MSHSTLASPYKLVRAPTCPRGAYHSTPTPVGAGTEQVTITFFKKEACDNPTPQGYTCTFTVTVASKNIGASMYNKVPFGVFYRDKNSGKWMMRPPF